MTMHTKAGARHSAGDAADIQAIHDLTVQQGAACGAMKASPLAIKALPGGRVRGYLVAFTSSAAPDTAGDYFDAKSDLGVKDGDTLPLLWHHNLDSTLRGEIGRGTVKRLPAGLWFEAILNLRSEYEKFVLKLVAMGKAGFSSGADPSLVERVPVKGRPGVSYLKTWWIDEGSITPTPAAGPELTAASLKALMGARGDDERRRRLLLEVELLQLEAEQETAPRRKARLLQQIDTLARPEPPLLTPGPTSGPFFAPFEWRKR